jgi:hypothetical protein
MMRNRKKKEQEALKEIERLTAVISQNNDKLKNAKIDYYQAKGIPIKQVEILIK